VAWVRLMSVHGLERLSAGIEAEERADTRTIVIGSHDMGAPLNEFGWSSMLRPWDFRPPHSRGVEHRCGDHRSLLPSHVQGRSKPPSVLKFAHMVKKVSLFPHD